MNGLFYSALLVWGVAFISSKAFKFEKPKRFTLVVVPTYSLIMFVTTMSWTVKNLLLLVFLAPLAVLIGWYQTRQVEIKDSNVEDKYGRPKVLVKNNLAYIIGWIAVFTLGISFHFIVEGGLSFEAIKEELLVEIKKDLFGFTIFSVEGSWYVWALSGISSFTYTRLLRRKDKKFHAALTRKKKKLKTS